MANPIGKALASVSAALGKAAMIFDGQTGPRWWGWQHRFGRRPWRAVDGYARNVDPQSNSAVAACLLWIARTFPEAPIRVLDAEDEEVKGHPLTKLLRRPNPYYSGAALWMATAIDYNATGNAYWLKERDDLGRVVRLWYEPSWQIRPTWPADGSKFLGGYERMINGQTPPVRLEDVVHFRFGLDPVTRLGVSPLATILSEIFIDDEATRFTAALLKNLGIPGVILAPKDATAHVEDDVAEELKTKFEQRFGGEKRGSVMVMQDPTDVAILSFSPQQMDLSTMHRLLEERAPALLGLASGVIGLGAGLDRNTYSNYTEAREACYEGNIIPTQRVMAAELDSQLLADLNGGDDTERVDFDLDHVRVLQPDEDAKAKRFGILIEKTIMRVDEARKEFGLEVKPEHEVFLVARGVSVVPAAELDKGVSPTGEQVTPAPGAAPPVPGAVPSSAPGAGGLPPSGNAPPQLMAVKAMVAPEGGESALSAEEIERLYEIRLATVAGSNGNGHSA